MIGNMPAETRMVPCATCQDLVIASDDLVCERCSLYDLYSDAYKEEMGFRPHPKRLPTIAQLKAWFEDYRLRHQ